MTRPWRWHSSTPPGTPDSGLHRVVMSDVQREKWVPSHGDDDAAALAPRINVEMRLGDLRVVPHHLT
jgi:hypothetical protein